MSYSAIIVAGGSGTRSGGRKQWFMLGGKPVLDWSVAAFSGARHTVVVVPEDDVLRARSAYDVKVSVVSGGSDRATSVQNGLKALDVDADEIVMIHDAARPLLTLHHINRLFDKLNSKSAAILALPVTDSLKRGDDTVTEAPSREGLWRAQTPQAFRYGDIVAAYAAWPQGETPTDDATVAQRAGIEVALVEGDVRLHKLTFPEDLPLIEAMMNMPSKDTKPARQMRVGQGFDAHRWGDGDTVWLCGIAVTHDQTLIGHSDADAGLHALTDAVLGAAGLGDIGDHFPPNDPQWKGASSDRFLRHAVDLVAKKGGTIVNVDVTLICERPKIKPHREAMRARLAELLGIDLDRVSVKATTTEGMGFTGRQEGLAAQAICAIEI